MKKILLPFLLLSLFFVSKTAYCTVDTLTIAEAISDTNSDFVPDYKVLGDTVVVSGVIISPNFQTNNTSYYLWDGTAGTDIFNLSSVTNGKLTFALGDSLVITGKVDQFNGVTEIVPLDSASWNLVGTGTVPDPMTITLAQYKADPEMYEGSLLRFNNLSLINGTWPPSSGSLYLSDGVDTVQFYIDSDTDIGGQPGPLYPIDVVGIGSQYDSSPPYSSGYEILPRYYTDFYSSITIAEAIADTNMDFVPDHKVTGDTVRVRGVITSPNFQLGNGNNEFFFSDGTAGVELFMFPPPQFDWSLGDSLVVTGTITQFNGVTELIPLDSASWDSVGTGVVPDPWVVTLAQYKANPEMYEGSLLWIGGLTKVSGNWSSGGSLGFSDGTDTVTFYIDSDTDIMGQTEPTYPVDIVGIGSQYDSSPPYDGGYEILPRYYTDFTPSTPVPVELVSFSASAKDGAILLRWSTATEINNKGFQVERKSSTEEWSKIAFVDGNGTTTNPHIYSYSDNSVKSGSYSYRLKQVDFDGSYKYSDIAEVSFNAVTKYELAQNYPNPFNPSTTISFSIPEASNVSLKIYNTLGQQVQTLVSGFKEAGSYKIHFDAKNLTSGLYFYKIEAGTFSQVKKMMLLK